MSRDSCQLCRETRHCTCHPGEAWVLAALSLDIARAKILIPALGAITCDGGVCCPDFGGDHGVIHCALQVADAVGSERIGIRLSPGPR
jgi:hypothetical protein